MANEPEILSILDKLNQLARGRGGRFDLSVKSGDLQLHLVLGGGDETASAAAADPPSTALAKPVWNKPGHGVVAQIAQNVLESSDPAAWQKLADIMDGDSEGRDDVITMARWPDDAKQDQSFHNKTGGWHYVDFPFEEGQPPPDDPPAPAGDNVLTKLPGFVDAVSSANGREQADAFAWVLHLAGDLHQPLHCATRITAAHKAPKGDGGGNAFLLGSRQNLHSLWDGLLVSDGVTSNYIQQLAGKIQNEFPIDAFSEQDRTSLDFATWAKESYKIAATFAYAGIEEHAHPPDAYMQKAKDIARKRAALGGYRLAALLAAIAAKMP